MIISENDKSISKSIGKDFCVIIPTYNNAGTIVQIIQRVLCFPYPVIIINDGSTDETAVLLSSFSEKITVLNSKKNYGKGHALKVGLLYAQRHNFRYVITLDADGQHFPEDISSFVNEAEKHHDALIIGSRILKNENMSRNSTFANRFSNFWFYIQTGRNLPDTQTGFRLYPLRKVKHIDLLTAKYEAELELLVFSSWHGIELYPIPIRVYYPPKSERVSHFRPFVDFFRITLLNTLLCFIAVIYGAPLRLMRFFRRMFR